jgi:WD40-like Beta Propeller Repeat
MPSIDDQLRDRLRGSAPRPLDGDDLVGRLSARKHRRETTRKAGTVALVACVLLATAGTFLALGRAFRTGPTPAVAPPSVTNGALVVSIPNEGSYHLMLLPPDRQDLDPSDGTTTAGFDSMERLTWVGGTQDTEPAVSPDGTTVAFVRKDSTDVPPALWLIDIDGTHERQVTRAPADVQSPEWSPDGSMIAFSAANEPGGRALYTIRPDGSDLHRLVDGPWVGGVAWSPDGAAIVFANLPSLDGGPSDLWVTSIDGSDVRQLTSSPDASEVDPTWSPDGSTIAYIAADGIMGMPASGGESRLLVPSLVGEDGVGRSPQAPAWSPDGSFLTFIRDDGTSPGGGTVFALPTGAADAFPIVDGDTYGWQPVPLTSASPSIDNLGLDFPICRVMSMPITIAGSPGGASVFTRADSGCPKAGEGDRFVAADLNGDGLVDTAPVQLHGCFPPVGCEAFAAPDVNADGTSEIAVSNAGADGYGVWLYALTPSPPAIQPIQVADSIYKQVRPGPLEFAWVDVAGHAEGAACHTASGVPLLNVFGYDKFDDPTKVITDSVQIVGTTADVMGESTVSKSLAEAPVPGNELCGAPLQGSAANFPNGAHSDQMDIGIGNPLCDVSKVVADFTGDGQDDTALVGMEGRDGRCTNAAEGTEIVALDSTGDGLPDGGYDVNDGCVGCEALAAADLDGDGLPELIVLHESSATPVYELIKIVRPGTESSGLVPIRISPDVPQMGLSANETLLLTAGGDEGSSFAIGCEGPPDAPVLVQWSSQHPVDGTGSDVRDVYETKLKLSSVTAAVIDSQHVTQPTSDPLPFDPLHSNGCGVQWFP